MAQGPPFAPRTPSCHRDYQGRSGARERHLDRGVSRSHSSLLTRSISIMRRLHRSWSSQLPMWASSAASMTPPDRIIGLPANSAMPPDVACGAADAVLDPDAEALERQAADVRIVAHLIAGEADADEGVVDAEIVQRLFPRVVAGRARSDRDRRRPWRVERPLASSRLTRSTVSKKRPRECSYARSRSPDVSCRAGSADQDHIAPLSDEGVRCDSI